MALREELKVQGDYLFKHRSYLPLLLLVGGLVVKAYEEGMFGVTSEGLFNKWLEISAIYVAFAGLLVRIFTIGYTPKHTSGRNTSKGQLADQLNTTGLYSLIRNPLYLGNYLMWAAIAMLTGSMWFVLLFTLIFWIYYERIVFAEEAFLRNKFGETYLNWAAKTPPFLPKHFRYVKPAYSFSWKKVLKKEKNGVLALFALFWLFASLEQYASNKIFLLQDNWLNAGLIGSLIFYLLIRTLNKTTNIFKEDDR